jgi:hypothetical protein
VDSNLNMYGEPCYDPDYIDPEAYLNDLALDPDDTPEDPEDHLDIAHGTPASREAIVHTFLDIPHPERTEGNWGCGKAENRHLWECNGGETYINGIILTVDMDYYMGYLIEVVDRTTSVISFHAITTYHGGNLHGLESHDSTMYQPACGTFFERTEEADRVAVTHWAVEVIYGMVEDHVQREIKAREARRASS